MLNSDDQNASTIPNRRDLEESEFDSSSEQTEVEVAVENGFQLSKQRWLILFAVSFFNFLMSLTSDMSTILHTMLELLEMPMTEYMYIRQLFNYLPIINTIPTAWLIDRFGIRPAMYAAVGCMLIRNLSSALMYNPDLPKWQEFKHTYWIITSIAGAQTASIVGCLYLKISESWFATSERSFAWTVMVSAHGVGLSIVAFVYPRYFTCVHDIKPLFYINIVCVLLATIAVLSCITRSMPKHPPSKRTLMDHQPSASVSYLNSVRSMLRQKNMMIHLFHVATFDAIMPCISSTLQDILTSSGHSEVFVGNLVSINSLYSMVAIVGLSTLVHRVEDITTTCKLAALVKESTFVMHVLTMVYVFPGWIVFLAALVYNTCKSWALPNYTNMTAHLAFGLVPVATVSGVGMIMTTVLSTVCNSVFLWLIGSSKKGKSDYEKSVEFVTVAIVMNTAMYLIFFRGKSNQDDDDQQAIVTYDC